ncbi:DUF6415 family natural product biosynthesis protein [Streptomyces sp. NPDC059010]|uniref:DUF6415 family natural product biosynthesis protein n=1 Tax=Streptomyces sp. NPDC059010 TaxID=3346695 RepID=UPI0036883830
MPSGEDVEVLDQRLRGHLTRLVDIAVAAEADQSDQPVAQLLEHASAMRVQDMPVDHRQAVGHLRRMGWAVNELLERLVETGFLKEAA